MKIDLHLHLVGVGTEGSGCWCSAKFLRRPVIRLLRRTIELSRKAGGPGGDQEWAERAGRLVSESELDAGVALGFDAVYDASGRVDTRRSQMVVPPEWVFKVCERHPQLLPGPSINPDRRDALAVLEEAIARGAVLIKWLPAVQVIDPGAERHRPFYRRLAESGVALLVHSGGAERTFAELAPEFAAVERLRPALEEGVLVICAHSGVPVHLSRDTDQLPLVRRLLETHSNFWLDNSGMANPSRFRHLQRLARDEFFKSRTLYGSDYPVPAIPLLYPRLGAAAARLQAVRNPLDRDVGVKRALGYPDRTLTRAGEVLPVLVRRIRGEDA